MSSAQTSGNCNQRKLWMVAPDDMAHPYIQNAMPGGAFEFMWGYIHFCNNGNKYPKGHAKYDPQYKVKWLLQKLMSGMNNGWISHKKVATAKSMIKCGGRAIVFVQYMPKKLFKPGIKVFAVCWLLFAVCCAFTAVLLWSEVYVVSANTDDPNTAVEVVKCHMTNDHLVGACGHILYTDNAKIMYEEYEWHFCGTTALTEKKVWLKSDVPFVKLSAGAIRDMTHGWFRETF